MTHFCIRGRLCKFICVCSAWQSNKAWIFATASRGRWGEWEGSSWKCIQQILICGHCVLIITRPVLLHLNKVFNFVNSKLPLFQIPCATLHDVVSYLVENTDGVLIPLIIEEPYDKSICMCKPYLAHAPFTLPIDFQVCARAHPYFCIFYFHSLHQSRQWKWRDEHSEHSGGLVQTSTRCAPQTRYCVKTTHTHTLTKDFVQPVFRDSVTHAAIWKFLLVKRFKKCLSSLNFFQITARESHLSLSFKRLTKEKKS